MSALRSRLDWCVNHGRIATAEWGRLEYGRVWRWAILRQGGYIAYLLAHPQVRE